MKPINEMRLRIESRSVNEGFARAVISAFAAQLDPNLEELSDIRTAVSEAVTNCIVHAYPDCVGSIYIWAGIFENGLVRIKIRDKGLGISDIKKAMEPLFTTSGEERAGLGFAVMESFCDKVTVRSKENVGTVVTLEKRICGRENTDD